MTRFIYLVRLEHTEKGIGFTAKTALQNAQRTPRSPITQAHFFGQPTGKETTIKVEIEDEPLTEIIRRTIETSGRMPNDSRLYTIEDIQFYKDGNENNEVESRREAIQRELTAVREENARLRQDGMNKRADITTPLDGLLAFFETKSYVPESPLEDFTDLDFARRVLSGGTQNTFSSYASHVLGKDLNANDVAKLLAYKLKDQNETDSAHASYETARKELAYLDKLRTEESDIPESLRADYIRIIEAKNHPAAIQEHEKIIREEKETQTKQEKLLQLQKKYAAFSEQLSLVNEAGSTIPVIFNFSEKSLDLYFPFITRDMKKGFMDDLESELKTFFFDATVARKDHTFVSYNVQGSNNTSEGYEHLLHDTPTTLRVAGFDKIIAYRLG